MKYSIEAWIYDPIAKEILLLKVKTEQRSFWQPITGGIESDESPEIACIREIFEETGLEIELTKLLQVGHHTVVIDEDLTIFKTLFLVEIFIFLMSTLILCGQKLKRCLIYCTGRAIKRLFKRF